MFTLLISMSIVTVHAFMLEMPPKAGQSVVIKESGAMEQQDSMTADDCFCQPGQCQSIIAQVDLSSDGILLPFLDLTRLNPISHIQQAYKSSSRQAISLANATLKPTRPPINIRYQSFLI